MATRYWVGNDEYWTDTSGWSTSPDGSGGASLPTENDDVVIVSGNCQTDGYEGGLIGVCRNLKILSGANFTFNSLYGLGKEGHLEVYGDTIEIESGANIIYKKPSLMGGTGIRVMNNCALTNLSDSPFLLAGVTSGKTLDIFGSEARIALGGSMVNGNGIVRTNNKDLFLYSMVAGSGGGGVEFELGSGDLFLRRTGTNSYFAGEFSLFSNNNRIIYNGDHYVEIGRFSIKKNRNGEYPDLIIDKANETESRNFVITGKFVNKAEYRKVEVKNLKYGFILELYRNSTLTVEEFLVRGESGKIITIKPDSSSSTRRAILVKKGGGFVSCDYLKIEASDASPANTWYAGSNSINSGYNNTGWIFEDAPNPPTTETNEATSVANIFATLNGEITSFGDNTPTKRGFAFGKRSQDPTGDPESSGYDDYWQETGTFEAGTFSHTLQGLEENTNYYFRAFAYNSDGYGWGEEMSFKTLLIPAPTIESIDPNVIKTETEETITITGQNFLDGLEVEIDNEPCSEIVVVDSETITCKTPQSETQKTATLKITNPDGKSGTFPFYYMKEIPNPEPKPKIEAKLEVGIIETI